MWVRARDDDRGRHGRREQHRLPGLGGHREDPLDVGQEAQVEHLVGLVEDQRVHVGDVQCAAVAQVDQAAGRADDDVDARGQRVELGVVADAAVDRQDAQAAVLARQVQVVGDLERELAGGDDDERLRLALGQVGVVGVLGGDAALEHRDAEREGLAGAGAGLADQVGAHQGDREGHLLDGERGGDVGALERVANLGLDAELSEGGQWSVAFVSSNGCGGLIGLQELRRGCRQRLPRAFPAGRRPRLGQEHGAVSPVVGHARGAGGGTRSPSTVSVGFEHD